MDRGPSLPTSPPCFAEEVLSDKEPIPDKLEPSPSQGSDYRPGGRLFLCPALRLLVSLPGAVPRPR